MEVQLVKLETQLPHWVKLRNGLFGKLEEWIEETGRFRGGLYTTEGQRVGYTFWKQNYDSLIEKGFDILNVKIGDSAKGWPEWTNTI
jgi:hypothetical protein